MDLYEKHIYFCIVFGIRGYNNENQFKNVETCKNGITCATHILQTVKTIVGVQSVFVGVSTGNNVLLLEDILVVSVHNIGPIHSQCMPGV